MRTVGGKSTSKGGFDLSSEEMHTMKKRKLNATSQQKLRDRDEEIERQQENLEVMMRSLKKEGKKLDFDEEEPEVK